MLYIPVKNNKVLTTSSVGFLSVCRKQLQQQQHVVKIERETDKFETTTGINDHTTYDCTNNQPYK
jgi:hypothetical protein